MTSFREKYIEREFFRFRARVVATIAVTVVFMSLTGGVAGAAGRSADETPKVIPVPSSLETLPGAAYSLTRDTRIIATSPEAVGVANFLAEILRRSTGYPLPVITTSSPPSTGGGPPGISLGLSGSPRLGQEGYTLDVNRGGVRLRAGSPEGLFRGTTTLRQLLPAKVESSQVQRGPWTVPGVRVTDRPRFGWRGGMLDVARHFFTVDDVKRYIDLAALYKINMLHLHLADDQGWRIVIDSWPRLATHGGSTEVGGGPGGFYTKRDYAEIVRYAAERFITVVPEIDMPGHTNAALASYAELNCDGVAPPLYTGTEVGFSSLCVDKEITYRFVDDVVREIAALTPGPYIHIGGDEAHSTEHADYVRFIERVRDIVAGHGKTMAGWKEIAGAAISPGSVAQYWGASTPSAEDRAQAQAAVRQGGRLVMSPCDKAYLDMKYDPTTPLGLSWCALVEAEDSYSWDPAEIVDGIAEQDIRGVEAPLWSETVENVDHIEFMTFPRLAGIAEIGWSPSPSRAGSVRSWANYRLRLAAHGPRWDVMSVNFYRSPQVPWVESAAPAAGVAGT